jgi:hypothetical protein
VVPSFVSMSAFLWVYEFVVRSWELLCRFRFSVRSIGQSSFFSSAGLELLSFPRAPVICILTNSLSVAKSVHPDLVRQRFLSKPSRRMLHSFFCHAFDGDIFAV